MNLLNQVMDMVSCLRTTMAIDFGEILGDPYSKKSPLPSIGNFPPLADSPEITGYQVFGHSRIQQRYITCYKHPRIHAQ
jgi:hypothetical protein